MTTPPVAIPLHNEQLRQVDPWALLDRATQQAVLLEARMNPPYFAFICRSTQSPQEGNLHHG